MSDFLTEFLAGGDVVAREVKYKTISGEEKAGEVHFRRISAGERAMLLQGQKASVSGKTTTVEIDLGENEKTRMMLVQFSVCRPDGTKAFKKLDEVQKLEAGKIQALYDVASEVNREEDPGKS